MAASCAPGITLRSSNPERLVTVIIYVPIVLSLLVLGAHFFRSGDPVLLAAATLLIPTLAIRRPWAARLVQAGLALGAIEWLRTTMILTAERMHAGAPYQRMLLILGTVAMITLISALLFQTRSLGRIYGLDQPHAVRPDPERKATPPGGET
ncbi:MAG: hypothetical protein PVG91_00180 [Gammaproteobacteria bacterium]|jgi:hypothetical protein